MQVVILAGGYGTRLAEETDQIPKPMVRIGDKPLLHHLIEYYASFGHVEFIIAAGYKFEVIRDYFQSSRRISGLKIVVENTGLDTGTGGRLLAIKDKLDDQFLLTYGDGLSNVNINSTIDEFFHSSPVALVTAVRPPARFGALVINPEKKVTSFDEKNPNDVGWINGGFFVASKEICSYIQTFQDSLEGVALHQLAQNGQLAAFEHNGWWQPMDTLREKRILEELLLSGNAPWLTGQGKIGPNVRD